MGFLELEVAHTHPVLVTFCHFLWKSVGKDMAEEKASIAFWRKVQTKKGNVHHVYFTCINQVLNHKGKVTG